jgi:hypothetical protein
MKNSIPALLFALVLSACAASPAPQRLPEIAFSGPRFHLEVAEVQVVDEYQPPFKLPNIEHQVPVPPARAAERWARDRLVPVGASGRAIVTIKNAQVIETSLRTTPGLRGTFTKDQAARYDAVIEMQVEIRPGIAMSDAVATARAERSRTVAEDVSPNEIDRMLFELVEGLMKDADAELDRNMRRFLVNYIRDVK